MANTFNLMRYSRSIFVAIALICLSEAAFSQYFGFTSQRKRESTSFKLVKNLIIIPLFINNKGPFNFVLDTGVGLVLITDPSFIKYLDPNTTRSVKINGIGEGNEMTALIHPSVKIKIGNSIEGSMGAAILKEDPFNLSSFVGLPIHGLIGYELFNSFIIRINYSSKTITYYRNETNYIPRKGTRVSLYLDNRKPYIESELKLSHDKKELVKLIIDTGAGHPLSLETSEGISYKIPEKSIAANLGVGLSGIISGSISRISELNIGRFHLKDVVCAFPDSSNVAAKTFTKRNGSLGNNILKRFDVVFDYQREALYLKKNYLFNEPFEHDMSGMEITTAGSDFEIIVISRVEQGSAAEKAGLKKDDRILSINFKKARDLGMEEISDLFRSQDGRGVVMEIQPKNSSETKFIFMTLKRRI